MAVEKNPKTPKRRKEPDGSKDAHAGKTKKTASAKRKKAPPKPFGKKGKSPPPKRWRLPWELKLLSLAASLLMVPLVVGVVAYEYFAQDLPSVKSLRNYRPRTVSFMYADDGRVIGEFFNEHRLVVPLSKVPRVVKLAFVAAEDANFYNHPGLDLPGIVRAMIKNIQAKRIVQGGSTITQQVTRSFLLSNEKTFRRKIREALLAYRLEKNLSKDEILHLYLNQIYLGRGSYGVESAAQNYFGKHVGDLTLAEAALLAGLVKAPGRYSPFHTPGPARRRQMYVLNRMTDSGFIGLESATAASREKLKFLEHRVNPYLEQTPQFTEHVRRLMEELVGAERLYQDGLRIYTTVNVEAQRMARKSVAEGLAALTRRQGYRTPRKVYPPDQVEAFLTRQAQRLVERPLAQGREVYVAVIKVDKKKRRLDVAVGTEAGWIGRKQCFWATKGRSLGTVFAEGNILAARVMERDKKTGAWRFDLVPEPEAQASLVCMETSTGRVKAMVGGRDFLESKFNRAVQARRQPGSAFKPFVYTAAMDSGFTQASVINDIPVEYPDQGRLWSPQNYGRNYGGPTTLYSALTRSVNVVAVRLLEKVGAKKVIEYAHRMGIKSPLGPNLSLALGSSEVTLMEMVSAFTTFPNLGRHAEPVFITRIEDRDGSLVTEFRPELVEAVSPATAYIVLDMLRGVVQRGTGRRVSALGRPVAGKTGTTNDHADAWFVGFTPGYAAGTWVGLDVRRTLGRGEQGGRTAAPIFLSFMKAFMKDKPIRHFTVPLGIVRTTITNITVNEEGEEEEHTQYLTFKKGRVGRGISEEPVYPEEDVVEEDGVEEEIPEDVRTRMLKHIQEFKSRAAGVPTVP